MSEFVVTAPTCTDKGFTTHTCHCGDTYVDSYVNATGHTPTDWIIDREPAPSVEGSKHKECEVCGETLETAIIEALPEVTEPETEPKTEPETKPETEPETGTKSNEQTETDGEAGSGCGSTVGGWIFLPLLLACFAIVRKKKFD